jgi:hypothetical protein
VKKYEADEGGAEVFCKHARIDYAELPCRPGSNGTMLKTEPSRPKSPSTGVEPARKPGCGLLRVGSRGRILLTKPKSVVNLNLR